MKRSEMLELLETLIREECDILEEHNPDFDYMLRFLEQSGMLPPTTTIKDENTGLFHGRKVNKWEEEDENYVGRDSQSKA